MAKCKKLRGGGMIDGAGGLIYSITTTISFIFLNIMPFMYLLLFFVIYLIMNAILAGTNFGIDLANMIIMPIVSGIIDMINGIIKGINSITG